MKRFYPLSVDRLEDRCVPAVVIEAPTAITPFVIDVYPIDPNALPVTPIDQPTIPGWSLPTVPVPPITSPFWY